ncbi:MAG: LTA synthase family protein [Bacteroidia bacterium]|nr:LTA synthase family protein [Bacteroidia bacterium]
MLINPTFYQFGFSELTFAFYVGLLFDFSAIIYSNSLLILLHVIPFKFRGNNGYQIFLKWYFYIVNSIAILLNLIDTEYYRFSGKRSGLELLNMRDELDGVWKNYISDYWYIILILILLIVFIVYGYQYVSQKITSQNLPYNSKQIKTEFIALFFIALITFLGARGGVNLTPISTFDAARISRAELVPLIVNTPFQFIVSTQQVGLKNENYFPNTIVNKYYNPVKTSSNLTLQNSKPNIVILIIESLGKEYVGYFNNGKGYTPFIDSLMTKSLVFNHAYANGKRSIEGIPAIEASLPTWMDNDYPNSYYQSNKLKGIGAYLSEMGYQTSFYHGGKNGTMSFDNFTAITNGGKYYGKNEYPNPADFDNHWGVYDEPYLNYFAKQLTANKTPFFSSLFTLSSHHPYSIPGHLSSKFTEGTLPIHRTIKYSDFALQQFFETAKKEPWYENTIFIITADHSAENEKPYYQTTQGKYEIPLFVFSANGSLVKPAINENTIQQIDILPMALNYANYTKPFFSFGSNVNQTYWAMQLTNGFYQFITWPFVYHFDGKKGIGFYDLNKDSLMHKNELENIKYKLKISNIDSNIKCIIQQYNFDLINNKTTE